MRYLVSSAHWTMVTALAFSASPAFAADVGQDPSTPPQDEAPVEPKSAPNAPVDEGALGGDIVVTAQKRAESLRDVPMSITALTGDQLGARGVTDASDLAKVVSGFTFNTDPRGAIVYTIRGIGFQESTLAASPTVSVYVDEVPLPYSQMSLGGSLDLERVEVLKGPQGTLYGQNSTGGLINYIAAKPTDIFSAGANARYGRFNVLDLSGHVSGPLTETLKVRVAARTLQGDAWQRNYLRKDELGKKNQWFARVLVDWEPDDRLRFALNLNAWRDRSETQASQLIKVVFQNPNPARWFLPLLDHPPAPANARAADWDQNRDYRRNNRFRQASLRAEFDVADRITLTSITSYQKYDMYIPIDNDGTAFKNQFAVRVGDVETLFQELRLGGEFANGGNWLVGANYQRDDTMDTISIDYSESTQRHVGGTIATDAKQLVDTYSVYSNLALPLTDTLEVTGGIRYTKQDRAYQGCSRDIGDGRLAAGFNALTGTNNFRPGECVTLITPTTGSLVVRDLDEDNISWRLGVKYEAGDDVMLYANATRGYKSGSFTTVTATQAGQLTPVTQESVLAYEAGFKAALLDRALQLNGAVFYYDYRNKQLRGRRDVPPFGALEGLVNIPKSHVIGAELDATIRPFTGLTINPSISYVKSKIEAPFRNFRADGMPPAVDLSGEPFPYTPKWTGNVDAEYRWDLSDGLVSYVGGSLSFKSHSYGGLGRLPDYRIPAYALLDLRAGVETADGRWEFSIWGQNVTNRYYPLSISRTQDVVSQLSGMPATYGISIGYRY